MQFLVEFGRHSPNDFVRMKNIVYFDLETQKSFQQIGGKRRPADLKMSLGVTYSTKDDQYEIYLEDEADALVAQLSRADLIVGYNLIDFDYRVLSAYTLIDLTQFPTLDIMVEVEKKLGFRIKLDSLSEATIGVGKTADGLDAIRWFDSGEWEKIAEYCCYDVKVTKLVHEFAIQHKKLFYFEKNTKELRELSIDI